MTDLFSGLPSLSLTLKPEFSDARGCKQWMQLLPLINVMQSQLELRETLTMINQTAIAPLERLRIMEVMRDTVALMQEEAAKKYLNKPSPLYPGEQEIWDDVVELWQAMATGYLHVLKAVHSGDPSVAEFAALVHERVIRNLYFIWREHAAVYALRPPELISKLHELYLSAVERGYANHRVKDSQYRLADASSCEAAYVQALLLEAANPNMMSVKQIYWIDRLLERWSQHAQLWPEPVAELPFTPLAVDLDSSRGLQSASSLGNAERVRYLDTMRLGQSVKKRIKHLRQGESPAQLGLGEEFSAAACENAMVYLYQQWCEGVGDRTFQRYQAQGTVEVVAQLTAIHCLSTGKPFIQPERSQEMSGKALRDMQMFGHVTHTTQLERAETIEYRSETWDLLDQSAMGCRLARPLNQGARVSHNQLFGVKIGEGRFNVGTIRWLCVDGRQLMVGLRLLPGLPQPVAVRATGLSPTGTNKYIPALLLPAVAAIKSPESLIVPPGWFRPTRILEIYAEPMPRRLRVAELLERGPDFERISFTDV